MIRSEVSVHSPESYCSLRGFAAQSLSIWWWMHCEPTKTALRLHGDCAANWKIFESVEKILLVGDSTANALKLTANELRLHWECAETAQRLWKLKNVQLAVESQTNSPKCESSIRQCVERTRTIKILNRRLAQITRSLWKDREIPRQIQALKNKSFNNIVNIMY